MGNELKKRRAGKRRADRGSSSRAEMYFGENSGKGARRQRKDAQLCRQIRDALDLAVAGLMEEALATASVVSVEPAPHIGHLRVVIEIDTEGDDNALDRAMGCLGYLEGELRAEVAGEIHRKKTPSLSFVVRPRVWAIPGFDLEGNELLRNDRDDEEPPA